MNKKYRGFLLVALGIIMVAAGLGLHSLQERQDQLAGENSGILLEALTRDIKFNSIYLEEPTTPTDPDEPAAESPAPSAPMDGSGGQSAEQEEMPSRTLSGYKLVGILKAPSVGVELPVLASWSYPLLNVAPCRYSGSLETGNLIILGHNYKSHLQPLERVSVGDSIQFTDVNGVVHYFKVASVENIHESDPEKLASEHPLIIFTCTRDGNHRIVLRCERAEK